MMLQKKFDFCQYKNIWLENFIFKIISIKKA